MKSGFDKKNIDHSVRPQDDFFHFAVGRWLKKNPIPKTESRWGSFYVLRDQARDALHAILERIKNKPAQPGTELQKLRDFYRTAMDEKTRGRQGITPLKKYLALVDRIQSLESLARVLGELHAMGFSALWTPIVDQDEKKSEETILHLWQASLILPDREYYLKSDKKSKEIRKEYTRYIERMLQLGGYAKKKTKKTARIIIGIETKLAKASRSRAALREVEKQYHKITSQALQKLAPRISWQRYFSSLGVPQLSSLIVGQPEFFGAVSVMVKNIPLEHLKMYLYWVLLDGAADFLSKKFIQERFRFHGKVISGTAQIKPLWQRVVMTINATIGEALGKLYIEKHFSPRAKKVMDALVDQIIRAYARRIQKLDWMSAGTKNRALKKLAKIRRKIGYPKRWRDYQALEIKPDSYLENVLRAGRFEHRRLLAKIGKPLDRGEWFMTPPTVNAYYSPSLNEIVFPAGILRPPFFDANAFEAVNYAGIGSVIGHELTHGFDDQGSKFDEKGNMREWWLKSDRARFIKKSELLIQQFNGYTVADGIRINGKLTLGENIADLGGLVIAYDAFREVIKRKRPPKTIDGWTPDQLFFLSFAQVEREHTRPEEERRLATIDPHSPPRYRANGTLSNIEEFYKAFEVKQGDKMFHRPEIRAKIW